MLTQRSKEKELMDLGSDYYTSEEYQDCLVKLFRVNRLLGFFHTTVKALRRFSNKSTLLDIGCGGGLFLLHLSNYFPYMKLSGTDISSEAIANAREIQKTWLKSHPKTQPVYFKLQKQPELNATKNTYDIILATLVCHHLTDEQLIQFLKDSHSAAKQAVIINDLHRHRLAEWLYQIISPVLFRNRLITHDGLISIRRGFKRREWQSLLKQAEITNYELKWCLPFRWQLILRKEEPVQPALFSHSTSHQA